MGYYEKLVLDQTALELFKGCDRKDLRCNTFSQYVLICYFNLWSYYIQYLEHLIRERLHEHALLTFAALCWSLVKKLNHSEQITGHRILNPFELGEKLLPDMTSPNPT